MNKDDIEKAAENAVEFTKKQGWPVWVKHLIYALIGAVSAVAVMLMTGCNTAQLDAARDAVDFIQTVKIERVK